MADDPVTALDTSISLLTPLLVFCSPWPDCIRANNDLFMKMTVIFLQKSPVLADCRCNTQRRERQTFN